MRRTATTLTLTCLLLLASAQVAMADNSNDGGEGWWGETNDKVVTNFGFLIIIFFPVFIFLMSMLQGSLERRKDRRKKAAKARTARADLRGGW